MQSQSNWPLRVSAAYPPPRCTPCFDFYKAHTPQLAKLTAQGVRSAFLIRANATLVNRLTSSGRSGRRHALPPPRCGPLLLALFTSHSNIDVIRFGAHNIGYPFAAKVRRIAFPSVLPVPSQVGLGLGLVTQTSALTIWAAQVAIYAYTAKVAFPVLLIRQFRGLIEQAGCLCRFSSCVMRCSSFAQAVTAVAGVALHQLLHAGASGLGFPHVPSGIRLVAGGGAVASWRSVIFLTGGCQKAFLLLTVLLNVLPQAVAPAQQASNLAHEGERHGGMCRKKNKALTEIVLALMSLPLLQEVALAQRASKLAGIVSHFHRATRQCVPDQPSFMSSQSFTLIHTLRQEVALAQWASKLAGMKVGGGERWTGTIESEEDAGTGNKQWRVVRRIVVPPGVALTQVFRCALCCVQAPADTPSNIFHVVLSTRLSKCLPTTHVAAV